MSIDSNLNKNILVTGGSGFIGSALVRKLLISTKYHITNIDKLSLQSNQESINNILVSSENEFQNRYKFIKYDLTNIQSIESIISSIQPEIIFHLAAESHVDRSILNPNHFVNNNVISTLNLINASLKYYEKLSLDKQRSFVFIHISTDEVFGSLQEFDKRFNEKSKYKPNSPYSASKAASDHIVRAWNKTYGFPAIITNCSNNYGPWQHSEKLIPLTISKALSNDIIPIYGNGENVRDWLFVEDHVDALIKIAKKGKIGESYCIGGGNEMKNIEVVKLICELLDKKKSPKRSFKELIKFVKDRPGHDFRYAINSEKILKELNWKPNFCFKEALSITVEWFINNQDWLEQKSTSLF